MGRCQRCGSSEGRIVLVQYLSDRLPMISRWLCPRCDERLRAAIDMALRPVGEAAAA